MHRNDVPPSCRIEVVSAPTPQEFARRYFRTGQPVVLEGLTQGWAPAECWTFASLRHHYGSCTAIAAVLANNTLKEDADLGVIFERRPLGDLVDEISRGGASHCVMTPVEDFPEEFLRWFRTPQYCDGAAYLRAKLSLGPAGMVTPLHWDVPHNLHVQLTGRKRWVLFPPRARRSLYPRGIWSRRPNFSRVDLERPDFARFPRLREVEPFEAVLEPGQTLWIPSGWWHHVRWLENSVSLNFWWGGRMVALKARASLWFKRVRGIYRNEWS